jgi:hypothetical protein
MTRLAGLIPIDGLAYGAWSSTGLHSIGKIAIQNAFVSSSKPSRLVSTAVRGHNPGGRFRLCYSAATMVRLRWATAALRPAAAARLLGVGGAGAAAAGGRRGRVFAAIWRGV